MTALAVGFCVDRATVGEWMTATVDTVSSQLEAEEAALWLLETGSRHRPVVEEDQLPAILSIRDVPAVLVQVEGGE